MLIFVWNTRGLNLCVRRRDLIMQIKKLSLSLVGLLEIKVKEEYPDIINKCLPSTWSSITNYSSHPSGRIHILRDPLIWNCTPISSTQQQAAIAVSNKRGLHCILSIAYGYNSADSRMDLRQDLISLSPACNDVMQSDFLMKIYGDFLCSHDSF